MRVEEVPMLRAHCRHQRTLGWLAYVLFVIAPLPTLAENAQEAGPEECRPYSGAAHLNCLYNYIELKKEQARKAENQSMATGTPGTSASGNATSGGLPDQMQDNSGHGAGTPYPPTLGGSPAYPAPYPCGYPPPLIYPPPVYAYPLPGIYLGRPYYYGHRFFGPRFFEDHLR